MRERNSTELSKPRVELANVSDRMLASKDVLARTVITAPVSGTVVNMRFKTEGGVVQRGQPILDIVPSDDVLLINARVLPTDIDVVHIGLKALVHFLAFASRNEPRIEGVVRDVGRQAGRSANGATLLSRPRGGRPRRACPPWTTD